MLFLLADAATEILAGAFLLTGVVLATIAAVRFLRGRTDPL
jgi:hypothetical protein